MFSEWLDSHSLSDALVPGAGLPWPPAGDPAWQALPAASLEEVRALAAAYREQPYPTCTATQFLAFSRTGDRRAWENPYFFRRRKLIAAVLGCCVGENDLDAVVDGIWTICEETSWVISAHNASSREEPRPLPDITNPCIDLFAAQTAMILSITCHLLESRLDAVTPLLTRRIRAEIGRRILTPFATRDDYWWMGFLRHDLNNWTPWIVSNVFYTVVAMEGEPFRRRELLSRGLRMLDRWLAVLPEDGGCDEGAGYWNMAGGSLLDALELLEQVTGGRMCFREDPKVRNILMFPLKARLRNGWFVNFADCDARPLLSGERLQRAGEMLEEPALVAAGNALRGTLADQINDTPHFNRLLSLLFHPVAQTKPDTPARDWWLPDLQLRVLEKGRLILVAKGGHNGENHNHNDVGSFMLYADGEPVIVDAGNMVYTAKTFSDERYSLWNVRSCWHNLPIIGGCEQLPGSEYRAEAAVPAEDGMTVSFASAYGPQAGVQRCERTLSLSEAALALTDTIALAAPLPVTWVLLMREKPELIGKCCRTGPVIFEIPKGLSASVEEKPVTDPRMARSFPGSLWRFTLTGTPDTAHFLSLSFTLL